MKFKSLFFTILFVLTLSLNFISAEDTVNNNLDLNMILGDLNTYSQKYNDNLDQVPKIVLDTFKNETIKVYIIETEDTNTTLSVKLEESKIIDIQLEDFEDKYTIDVFIQQTTIENILNSSDKASILKKALKEKEVKIKGKGFFKSIKFGIISFISNFI